jgi:pimeloyl-ACP methyl ester carboxylesterase
MAAFAAAAETMIVDVLDALDVDAAPVVATSLGGYHLLRSAAAHPDRVTGAVELGWLVGAPMDTTPLAMRLGGARRLGKLMARLPVTRSTARALLRQIGLRDAINTGRVSEAGVAWFRSLLNDTHTMRNDIDASPPIMSFATVSTMRSS